MLTKMLSYDRTTEKKGGKNMGIDKSTLQIMANSGIKSAQDQLDRMEKREATKSIIGHAVAGGIIAGPAGAVVGGMIGQTKNNMKKK